MDITGNTQKPETPPGGGEVERRKRQTGRWSGEAGVAGVGRGGRSRVGEGEEGDEKLEEDKEEEIDRERERERRLVLSSFCIQ